MIAYARVLVDIPVEIPDKYEALGGWEPEVTGEAADALKGGLWEDTLFAVQEKLTSSDIYDDELIIEEISDEWGFILDKGD